VFVADLLEFLGDVGDKPVVSGHAHHIVQMVVLAPGHDVVAAEARVPTDDDLGVGPPLADLIHDAVEFVHREERGVLARRIESAGQ